MQLKKIDGEAFKSIVMNGAENLRLHYQEIDALNVFPIPDGDTGINMLLTIQGGIKEIRNIDTASISEMAKYLSQGMLMHARGNSGVILSQLFRGFCIGLGDAIAVNAIGYANAMLRGVEQAYKTVIKPVEGTILTVAREAAEKAKLLASSRMTIEQYFSEYIKEARKSLARTPNLLPVLKEAGVVDSGASGLLCIIEGMDQALNGEFISADTPIANLHVPLTNAAQAQEHGEFGYCTEFIVDLEPDKLPAGFSNATLIGELEPLGDSMVIVHDENLLKVHIHTLVPENVLGIAHKYGEFIKLKIDNMSVQHSELQIEHKDEGMCVCGESHEEIARPQERAKYAVVAVATGKGLIKTFQELGCDHVIPGGQSMNPSTEDFVRAYDHLNADNIIVFPNNKNIILAAEQSAKVYNNGTKIWVVPSKTIAQGFSALTMIDLEYEPEKILEDAAEIISQVTTIQVTYAIRTTQVNGLEIKKGDCIGIVDGELVATAKKRMNVVLDTLKQAITQEKSLLTIIYGKDVQKKEIHELEKYIDKNYGIDVDIVEGNQEIYSYIIAVE